MLRLFPLILTVLAVLLACAAGPHPDAVPEAGREPVTCMPDGLDGTHRVGVIPPPDGCSFSEGGTAASPLRIPSAAELASRVVCRPDAPAALTQPIDFSASDVYLVTHTLSPAYGGGEIRDDGAVITFVTRFRPPCPDDPMPMPIQSTFGFELPSGGARSFREANCSLPEAC